MWSGPPACIAIGCVGTGAPRKPALSEAKGPVARHSTFTRLVPAQTASEVRFPFSLAKTPHNCAARRAIPVQNELPSHCLLIWFTKPRWCSAQSQCERKDGNRDSKSRVVTSLFGGRNTTPPLQGQTFLGWLYLAPENVVSFFPPVTTLVRHSFVV